MVCVRDLIYSSYFQPRSQAQASPICLVFLRQLLPIKLERNKGVAMEQVSGWFTDCSAFLTHRDLYRQPHGTQGEQMTVFG
jgi:hypothetical protein